MTVTESKNLNKGARVYWRGAPLIRYYHRNELGCGHDRLG